MAKATNRASGTKVKLERGIASQLEKIAKMRGVSMDKLARSMLEKDFAEIRRVGEAKIQKCVFADHKLGYCKKITPHKEVMSESAFEELTLLVSGKGGIERRFKLSPVLCGTCKEY